MTRLLTPLAPAGRGSATLAAAMALALLAGCSDGPPAPDRVGWGANYENAKRLAVSRGKPILLVFSSRNCPACVKMDREVFTDEALAKLIRENFIPVKLDLARPDAPAEAARAQFNVATVPTLILLSPAGKEQARESRALAADELKEWLSLGAGSKGIVVTTQPALP